MLKGEERDNGRGLFQATGGLLIVFVFLILLFLFILVICCIVKKCMADARSKNQFSKQRIEHSTEMPVKQIPS